MCGVGLSCPLTGQAFWTYGVGIPPKRLPHMFRAMHCCSQLPLSESVLAHSAWLVSLQNTSRSAAVVSDFCRLKENLGGGRGFPGEIKESAQHKRNLIKLYILGTKQNKKNLPGSVIHMSESICPNVCDLLYRAAN